MDSFLRINDARPLTNRDYLTVMNDDSETRVGNEQRSRGNLGQQDNETEGESHRFSRSIIYTRNGKRARRIPQFSSVRAPGWERGEKKNRKRREEETTGKTRDVWRADETRICWWFPLWISAICYSINAERLTKREKWIWQLDVSFAPSSVFARSFLTFPSFTHSKCPAVALDCIQALNGFKHFADFKWHVVLGAFTSFNTLISKFQIFKVLLSENISNSVFEKYIFSRLCAAKESAACLRESYSLIRL